MPVEFSVAAYRFGHSMIRSRYRLNRAIESPIFSSPPAKPLTLGGSAPSRPTGPSTGSSSLTWLVPGQGPTAAYKIDTSLASPLRRLPAHIANHPSSLALRNLERGGPSDYLPGRT